MKSYSYLVICLNDDGEYVVATHKFFNNESLALNYIKFLPESRKPIIVSVDPERFLRRSE